MLKWITIVKAIGGNERYVSFPVHFRFTKKKFYCTKGFAVKIQGVRLVNLGRILILWPDRTEMVINYQNKAQLLIKNKDFYYSELRTTFIWHIDISSGWSIVSFNSHSVTFYLGQNVEVRINLIEGSYYFAWSYLGLNSPFF